MLGLTTPGSKVWLSQSDSATRKYKHTWELIEAEGGVGTTLVGINTNHPNALVTEAITSGLIEPLAGYKSLRREVKYGVNSRIDILLERVQIHALATSRSRMCICRVSRVLPNFPTARPSAAQSIWPNSRTWSQAGAGRSWFT